MSNLIVKIFSNLSTRIMFIFYISIIAITTFFIIFGYYNQLALQEQREHDKLKGIVSSLALAINGDEHDWMMKDHPDKDDIETNEANVFYHKIHKLLAKAVTENSLNSPIYTLVYVPEKEVFEFGVTSDPTPYYRHDYMNYPKDLVSKMDEGGIVPLYESENGMWLSAFHPIKDKEGNTVGLIEADTEFSSFIAAVRSQYLRQSLYALGAILLLAVILIPYTRKVLKEDERQKQQLRIQSDIIQEKNRDITDSINYALKIQNSILPSYDKMCEAFKDFGILYKPKDIVAGDFYFMERVGDDVFIAAADCTGHGVPGAMVSVICSNALSFAVRERGLTKTGEILDVAREIVVRKFQGSPDGIKDGMDVAICRFNLKKGEVEYSGANNPLYVVQNKEINTIKPDKQPVGQFDHASPFKTHLQKIIPGATYYLFSDGYADQFGGEKGKKLKYKSFKQMLINHTNKDLSEQMNILDDEFESWRGEFEQVDDVCVIAVRV